MNRTPRRILLVEDEPKWQEFFSDTLHAMGYEVDVAPDFATGKRSITHRLYDLVLLDVGMDQPGFNVICQQFCEYLRNNCPNLSLLAMSGKELKPLEMTTLFRDFRPDDFISKGAIDLPRFRNIVQTVLDLGEQKHKTKRRSIRPPDAHKFDVFLSHNSKDGPVVRELKQRLVAQNLAVWFDDEELQPGMPWQHLLERGIRSSASVAVLVGKDGLGPWEDEEMQVALRLAVKDRRPVIPVLLPVAPNQPKLPMFLENRKWVDLRAGFTAEGLARLVWGITGKKP